MCVCVCVCVGVCVCWCVSLYVYLYESVCIVAKHFIERISITCVMISGAWRNVERPQSIELLMLTKTGFNVRRRFIGQSIVMVTARIECKAIRHWSIPQWSRRENTWTEWSFM